MAGSSQSPCACAGTAGAAGAVRCPDLDGNRVLDCDESVVRNGTFDQDARHWTEELGLRSSWSDADAHERASSGSMLVESTYRAEVDGLFMTGARQCLDVGAPAIYRGAAEILIPPDQEPGTGGIQLVFYDEVGCTGQVVASGTSNTVVTGSWKILSVTRESPAEAKSLAFRLIAIKSYSLESFRVLFDNVLVRAD